MMKRLLITLAAIGVLIMLFIALAPKASAPQTASRHYDLVVKDQKLTSGPAQIKVTQGDHVSITITTDAGEELHLHGYDRKVELEAAKPATLTFIADTSGRFEYELEHSGTVLGELDVEPK